MGEHDNFVLYFKLGHNKFLQIMVKPLGGMHYLKQLHISKKQKHKLTKLILTVN